MERIAPLSTHELARLPVGVQPEEDGRLACLDCGRWYRSLGAHVAGGHGYSADEYRRRYQLPRRRGLVGADLRQAAADRARTRSRSGRYPRAIATRLRGTAQESRRAVAAQRESWTRAGTRAALRDHWTRNGQRQRRRHRDRYEELARAAGYRGLDHLIAATVDESAGTLAARLSISTSGATWLRRLHAADFNLDHHPTPPPAVPAAWLALLAPGVQPATETWLLCRECGHWFKGLPRHLTVRHGLTADSYRTRYRIQADLPLLAADRLRANIQPRLDRITRRAQRHGYPDLPRLIDHTREWPSRDVARLLEISKTHVYNLRQRHPAT